MLIKPGWGGGWGEWVKGEGGRRQEVAGSRKKAGGGKSRQREPRAGSRRRQDATGGQGMFLEQAGGSRGNRGRQEAAGCRQQVGAARANTYIAYTIQ